MTALVVEVSEEWVTGRRYLDMEELGEHRGLEELVVETDQPRTQARAFHVTRFVWEIEAAYGRRPSWPEMCKLWNDSPMTRPFENWRDFRIYLLRGKKATLPRYKGTDEEITEQVIEASSRGRSVAFDLWVSQVLAATVQQDHDAR